MEQLFFTLLNGLNTKTRENGVIQRPNSKSPTGGIKLTVVLRAVVPARSRLFRLAGRCDIPVPLSTYPPVRDYEFGCWLLVLLFSKCFFFIHQDKRNIPKENSSKDGNSSSKTKVSILQSFLSKDDFFSFPCVGSKIRF
jgi:hypothetical protein